VNDSLRGFNIDDAREDGHRDIGIIPSLQSSIEEKIV